MFEETLRVILGLAEIEPIEALPPGLDALFDRLRENGAAAEAWHIEDDIWEMWTAHPDTAAGALMTKAITAVAGKHWNEAQALLDDLVRAQPLWPEAWNKRATLAFLRGEMQRAPAISAGPCKWTATLRCARRLRRICLRHGEAAAALRIHPHQAQMRMLADELRRHHPPTLHCDTTSWPGLGSSRPIHAPGEGAEWTCFKDDEGIAPGDVWFDRLQLVLEEWGAFAVLVGWSCDGAGAHPSSSF